jgi:hypothetical protein
MENKKRPAYVVRKVVGGNDYQGSYLPGRDEKNA